MLASRLLAEDQYVSTAIERSAAGVTEKTSPKLEWTELDQRAVDTVRVLAMDAVEKVGNGHPGTAMSLAPAAYLLFQKVMRHNPADPHWAGRERFVLSAGHDRAPARHRERAYSPRRPAPSIDSEPGPRGTCSQRLPGHTDDSPRGVASHSYGQS